MSILITGFQPFGDFSYNPSGMVAEEIVRILSGMDTVSRTLPVSSSAGTIYNEYINEINPEFIINIGLKKDTSKILLEKTALNILDYGGKEDNEGRIIPFRKIAHDGPDGFISGLDLHACQSILLKESIPAAVSYSAGTFICNLVYYTSFMYFYIRKKPYNCIFLHIPFDTEYTASLLAKRDVNICHIPKNMLIDAAAMIIREITLQAAG